jgi:Tfp pilus assembly protein PilW
MSLHIHTTRFTARLRRRCASERGFSLIELLLTMTLMIVVLAAVVTLADSTRSNANADQKRSDTLDVAQAGLSRMVDELRQACYLVTPGAAAATSTGASLCGYYSNTWSVGVSGCGATAQNNCIDFVMRGRPVVTRDGGGTVTSVARSVTRVRYLCSTTDPRDPRGTSTQCERFAVGCTTTPLSSSCPAATTANGATDTVLTGSVTNSAVTSATAPAPGPIFTYCARATALSCSATFSALPSELHVELAIARRGTLRNGLGNSIDLKQGVELRNLNPATDHLPT